MQKEYDLLVIGGGPGGYTAAIKAAQSGLTVALIEKDKVGGTCLNRGCIPTKTLMHTSRLWKELSHCDEIGIEVGEINYNIEKMYLRKDRVTAQLREGIEFLLKSNQIDLVEGVGTVTENHIVKVQLDGQVVELNGKHILIASGSIPSLPPIKGISLPGVITSNELLGQYGMLHFHEGEAFHGMKNKKLVVIGGGVIGVEFATIFNALGYEVIIIESMERLLPAMDREISQNLNMILKRRGIKVHTSATVVKIDQKDNGLVLGCTQRDNRFDVETGIVLVAVGRKANLEDLFDQKMAVEVKHGIVVNEHFETSIAGIYAIGDVIEGGVQLAHVASAQGLCAIAHICGKEPVIDLNTIPSCIYTDPEIASVGMDVDTAKKKGISVKTGKFTMSGNGKSVIEQQERGFIKLVFEAETEVILGAQLMCARATDLISELSTAIVNKLTISKLSAVIRPHPTFTEGVTEAVENAAGNAIHIVPKKIR